MPIANSSEIEVGKQVFFLTASGAKLPVKVVSFTDKEVTGDYNWDNQNGMGSVYRYSWDKSKVLTS